MKTDLLNTRIDRLQPAIQVVRGHLTFLKDHGLDIGELEIMLSDEWYQGTFKRLREEIEKMGEDDDN